MSLCHYNVRPPTMSTLKNLSSLRKKIARRIRQALSELQENLGKGQLVPAPIPIPMRSRRLFRTCPGHILFNNGFCTAKRFYASYLRFCTANRFVGSKGPHAVLRNKFSAPNHFRLKLFAAFYARPSVTELLKMNVVRDHESKPRSPQPRALATVPAALRLNVLLSKQFHNIVMDLAHLASGATVQGCYVEFHIQPRISIPQDTFMSADVLLELLVNLQHFEKHIRDLQRDLARLAELGELPVQVLGPHNTIRVYFPNCDRERLEILLREKNIVLGIVYEDSHGEGAALDDASVSLLLDLDLLSNYSLLSLVSSDDYDEVLSSDSDARPVDWLMMDRPLLGLEFGRFSPMERLGSGPMEFAPRDPVQIVDDYYWA